MQLMGKTVFVTGGAGGLGSAFARSFIQNGAQVCIVDLNVTMGQEVAADLTSEYGEGKVIFVECDVTDADSLKGAFETAVKTFKQVDIMINNAAVHNEESWEKMLVINLNGVINGTSLALSHMRKDKGGKGGVIINIASYLGLQPCYILPVYTASKHGIIGYTRSMATTPGIKAQGVRFACLCPGKIDTPLLDIKLHSAREGYFEDMRTLISGDGLKPETVAEGLLSLIDDEDSNDTLLFISLEEGTVRRKITLEDVLA